MTRLILVLLLVAPLFGLLATSAHAAQSTEVTFIFGEEVSDEDEAVIREGIRFARAYTQEQLGRIVERAFTVDAHPEQEFPSTAYVADGAIFIATNHQVWLESSPMHKLKIVVHEYFHLVQYESVRDPRVIPLWLMEGSAELFAYQAVASLGLVNWNAVADYWTLGMFNDPATAGVSLQQMAQPEPAVACCIYSVSPLAVIDLIAELDWPALLGYFDIVNSMPPDDAFVESFGRSPVDFYAEFEAARWQMTTTGTDLSAMRLPWYPFDGVADVWGLEARSPVERGGQAFVTGWTAPGARCTLDFVSASGNHLLTQPARANSDGKVFWLFSVRTRLAEGAARADVTCGTNSISATIDLT